MIDSIKVQRVQYKDPSSGETRYRVSAVSAGTVSAEKLAKDIASDTGVHRNTVLTVINSVCDAMMRYMELGHSVQLGNLATMCISVQSKAVESEKECKVSTIEGVKVSMVPHTALRRELESVTFSMDALLEEGGDSSDGDVVAPGGNNGGTTPGTNGGNANHDDGGGSLGD